MADLVCDDNDESSPKYRSSGGFKNFFRMSSSDFEQLLCIIGPQIKKANTSYIQSIPMKERLGIYGNWRFVQIVGNDILDILFNYFKVHTRGVGSPCRSTEGLRTGMSFDDGTLPGVIMIPGKKA
ncbi:hypothetical protein PR048_016443 [Dryococelus australis]|uniref:Uncharacterized protein n=1 Tax=Dryococelus australis TaxID=614101 RepID=A0ABQ9HKA4_9NEOP|nr:hypothetical protein PR048_016443 [Dryococelus australis]